MTTSYAKKKQRNIIALTALLVVLATAVIVLPPFFRKSNEAETGEQGTYYLTNLSKEDITGVRYARHDDEFNRDIDLKYVFDGSKWYYEGDRNLPLSQATFEGNVIEYLYKLQAGRKISEPKELSFYGLDNPVFKLEITLKNDVIIEIDAGNYNEIMQAFYVKKSGDDSIYMMAGTIDGTFVSMCRDSVYEYAELDVMPSYSASDIEFIFGGNGDHKYEIAYRPNGVKEDLVGDSKWYFKEPFSRFIGTVEDKFTSAIKILTGVGYAQLADYDAAEEELKSYGITDSDKYFAVSYYAGEKDDSQNRELRVFRLIIGNLNETGEYYYVQPVSVVGNVQTKSNKISFVSKASIDAAINLDPLNYIYRYGAYVSIDNMVNGSAKITSPEGSHEIFINMRVESGANGDTNVKEYTCNGNKFDKERSDLFSSFYKLYMQSFIKRIIYDKSTIKEVKPVYSIEHVVANVENVEKILVEYTLYDDNYYQVTVNGATDVLVSRTDIDNAFAEYAKLVKLVENAG